MYRRETLDNATVASRIPARKSLAARSVHILHVVEAFAAGTLQIVTQMANTQAGDGYRVGLLYSSREETPANWRSQMHPAVEVRHLPMRRSLSPAADIRATVELTRLVRKLKPDIVHLHSSKAGAIGRIASLLHPGARWYFSPHGLSFLQSNEPGRVHRVYLALERLLARTPATLVACSPSEASLIRQYLRRTPILVPNGIPLDSIRRQGDRGTRPLTVGTAGRITEARNPRLFAAVARQLMGTGLRFVWLGGGEAQDEQELREAGVEISGWLPHAKLLDAMTELDIYLQPSRWEGLPVAVMEAMATGLPVVATDIVGNRDLVQHGRTGWLAGSEDELVAGVRLLAGDASLRLRCGRAAREHVYHQHSTGRMMQCLYEAYGLALQGARQDIPTMEAPRGAPYIGNDPPASGEARVPAPQTQRRAT